MARQPHGASRGLQGLKLRGCSVAANCLCPGSFRVLELRAGGPVSRDAVREVYLALFAVCRWIVADFGSDGPAVAPIGRRRDEELRTCSPIRRHAMVLRDFTLLTIGRGDVCHFYLNEPILAPIRTRQG